MSPSPVDVWFVLPDGSLVLDWAGPSEAFRMANAESGGPFFSLRFCAPQPTSQSSVGPHIMGLEPLPETLAAPAWIVLVGKAGAESLRNDHPQDQAVCEWLQRLRPGRDGLRLITICSGALLAARAGLLHKTRCTTHHLTLNLLRLAAPTAQVAEDRVFVQDGEIWTSAGVTAGIDIALHLVSAHCGALVAARTAQRMAVALRRGPDDPQLSPFLAHRQHLNAKLHRVQDAVSAQPAQAWSPQRMAELAHTTERSLNRLFALHTQTSPSAYLRAIRLSAAKAALAQGASVGRAAELAGFSSDLQLRRAWAALAEEGLPSGQSRKRIAPSSSAQTH